MSNNIDETLINEVQHAIDYSKCDSGDEVLNLLDNYKGLIEDYAVLLKEKENLKFYCKKLIKNPSADLSKEVLSFIGGRNE